MNKLAFVGFCVLLCFTSCKNEHEKIIEKETEFLVTSPVKMDTTLIKEYVCQIHAIQHIELRAQERGYLEKIYVDEGQLVKKGQPLFQIMPKLYQAELEKAKAETNFAEIEYKNTKQLADQNVVAPNELAMAKAKLEKAKAELSLAKVHLDFTLIKAPFDGIIDRFHVRLGSLVDEGELLTNLSDNTRMWVYYNVPEAEYLDFKMNTNPKVVSNVQLQMPNNKLFSEQGVVETIEADFNNETGNIPFRATFPNPMGLLRHGETGSILSKIPLTDVVLIPQKATFEVLDKKYVYIVDKDQVVHSKEIIIGEEIPHLYVVKEGLSEQDHILIEGLRLVRENDKIYTQYQKPDVVLSRLQLYAE
ncbi:efflux RND transporter periplasmic adaptor subunit [Ochrovirga pacifica]|uniref:efflux RND transporter periplasmic adaptor subunit n=1 Tax=Ochrovirga pacifica TaxID=1042376 RepID=UPI0002558AAB|nr:efflux RND transporter periplasmic adaptor subunit [Ochrovirga pacifica]